jgi:preprotein translocase subunit YajC
VTFVIIMALALGVMYVTMIRPQRQRQAQQQSTVESAGVGDDVLTTGGIYGTITEAEGDDIVVEIAPAVTVHMTRRGIAAVLPPEEEHEDVDEDGDEDEAEEADEGAVTDGEEAVRSAAGDAPSGDGHR